MLKIMFNDAYCLTEAVLSGDKVRTTRFEKLPDKYRHYLNMKEQGAIPFLINVYDNPSGTFTIMQASPFKEGMEVFASFSPRYKKGETYAIAQPYRQLPEDLQKHFALDDTNPGWSNKMFVKAGYMPWRIRIVDVEILPLYVYAQSEQLCLQEGIQKAPDVFPDNMRYSYMSRISGYESAKYFNSYGSAIASLMNDVCGHGTWKNHYNDWVVSYKFEVEPNIIL